VYLREPAMGASEKQDPGELAISRVTYPCSARFPTQVPAAHPPTTISPELVWPTGMA